jgi:hypothetical protein
MDEFSKARGTFALTAVALAIKLALSSLKYLRGIWKAAGFLVALLLAASFLVVTNHWVTQRHSVVVSRTPQNIQKEAPKSTSQTDSPTTAPSPSRLLEKDSDNSGEQKKTEKKGTSGRQTQLTGGQKTTKVPPMINAPNGIAIGGGTVLNPTVNNNYAVQDKPDSQRRRQAKDCHVLVADQGHGKSQSPHMVTRKPLLMPFSGMEF